METLEIVILVISLCIFLIFISFTLCICLNPIDDRNLISNFADVDLSDRVFNIGLHRTGTSSMADALSKLGYKVWHGPYFKRLENRYFEKFNALADTQVKGPNQPDFNFKRLYSKFPDAKFILTMRDDQDKWVKSIYKSNHKWKPYQIVIPEDYINTNFCKDLITPRQARKRLKKKIAELSDEDLKQIYNKHNNEIIDFFKDKPGQLLIFDVTNGDSWEKLCEFLNKPVPKTKFPKMEESDLTFKLSMFKTLGVNMQSF